MRIPESDEGMNVIGHDHITNYIMAFAFQMVKPFVHFFISSRQFKQVQPVTAGNGDEVNTIEFGDRFANAHGVNLTIGCHPRRVPETGNSAEKEKSKKKRANAKLSTELFTK